MIHQGDTMFCSAPQNRYRGVTAICVALVSCVLPGSAQDAKPQDTNSSLSSQPAAAKQSTGTLTLKDALALAEKNDPGAARGHGRRDLGARGPQAGARGFISLALRTVGISGNTGQRQNLLGPIRHQRRRPRLSRLGGGPPGFLAGSLEPDSVRRAAAPRRWRARSSKSHGAGWPPPSPRITTR